MIPEDIIETYNPSKKVIPKHSFVFMENGTARFYFQIITGKIEMVNINPEGKEFVQGIFENGQSFGEPPLFHGSAYPAAAKAVEATTLYKLRKEKLFELLKDHPNIHLNFTTILTKRLMYKAMMMKEISSHDAKHRILTFLDYLKGEYGKSEALFHIDLTRQQLSNLLGIRVETVIRTIKQLAASDEISLKGRKIFR